MKLKQITAVARPIDPKYPTNRAILIIGFMVIVITAAIQLISGEDFWASVSWGGTAGVLTIVTWALGREIDPDHEWSAFVAVTFFVISLFFLELPSILPSALTLLALRPVNRTVGLPITTLDSMMIAGLGLWLFASMGLWALGLVVVLAFLLDGLLPSPSRRQLLFGLIVMILMLVIDRGKVVESVNNEPIPYLVVAGLTAVLFIPLIIFRSKPINTIGDATGQPLLPIRIQAAQALALAIGLLLLWQANETGIVLLLPLWLAMLGVSLFRIFTILK